MVIASLLEQCAVYWSILYNRSSPFDQRPKWKMMILLRVDVCVCLCVYKHLCRKRKKIKRLQHCVHSHVFTLVARATTERTKQPSPWKQQRRESEWSDREARWRNGELQGNRACITQWTKGRLEHAVLLRLAYPHRQKDGQTWDAVFLPVCTSWISAVMSFPPQCSGWWPSESWEEGQRSVWVHLCDEHSHRVLLPYPGERCVRPSIFYTPTSLQIPHLLSLSTRHTVSCKALDASEESGLWLMAVFLSVENVSCLCVCVLQALALCQL